MKFEQKIEQLPSGSYRVRKQIKGKMIRITFDHRPTESEIIMAFGDHLKDTPAPKEMLIFLTAAKQYVELKRIVFVNPILEIQRKRLWIYLSILSIICLPKNMPN